MFRSTITSLATVQSLQKLGLGLGLGLSYTCSACFRVTSFLQHALPPRYFKFAVNTGRSAGRSVRLPHCCTLQNDNLRLTASC